MAQIPMTNDGKNPRYVGTVCILPGETRHVDASLLPAFMRQPSEPEPVKPAPDKLDDLLAGKVADIVKAMPELPPDEFERLRELELESEKPRTSLLKAIYQEEIRRADAKVNKGGIESPEGANAPDH